MSRSFHMKSWSCFPVSRDIKNTHPNCLLVLFWPPLPFYVWYCWQYLCRLVYMIQIWYSVCCNLDSDPLGWWPLGRGIFISHFWMGMCLRKLSCLVLRISSLILWIFRKVWSDIQISLDPWFFRWISRFPLCDNLRRMCVYGMVLKNCKGDQIHCNHGNKWCRSLYIYTRYSLASVKI